MCAQYLAERTQNVTEFLDVAMATFLPAEYAERSRIYDEDMQQLASSSNVRNKRERELFFCYFFLTRSLLKVTTLFLSISSRISSFSTLV